MITLMMGYNYKHKKTKDKYSLEFADLAKDKFQLEREHGNFITTWEGTHQMLDDNFILIIDK